MTTNYGLYRGTLPFTGSDHSPYDCNVGETSIIIPSGDDESSFFLAVAQNAGKEGSHGLDSSNVQRPVPGDSCLPQAIGICN